MIESELLERYFLSKQSPDNNLALGIGDDAAVITVPEDKQLVVSTDTLVSGVHFHHLDNAEDIGYKALAVNLSDMAAMGAEPKWVSLSLTIPEINNDWLKSFSSGFFQLANEHFITLIGGDLCRGPLSITIHIQGLVSNNKYLTRSGAKSGDRIYVTGSLGDAGIALKLENKDLDDADYQYVRSRLLRPVPRVAAGLKLNEYVNSMIDLSDGLFQDLNYILKASQSGADLFVDKIPLSQSICNLVPYDEALALALGSGDDYELCFTAAADLEPSILNLSGRINCPITMIGEINDSKKLKLLKEDGQEFRLKRSGFQHFSS